jgi:hypothetical protein
MIHIRNKHTLRILGITIWLCGLLFPWFRVDFEPYPSTVLLAGWEEILITFRIGIEALKDGYDNYLLVSLVEGSSLLLLAAYITYAVFAIKKEFAGNRYLSAFLAGIIIINIFFAHLVTTNGILFGFWMFILGLLLCAIVESTNR